jgi:hypothetical protein
MPSDASREQLQEWVDIWKRAGKELAAIEHQELLAMDTGQALRHLFGDSTLTCLPPAEPWSGLVEQQARFARLRK